MCTLCTVHRSFGKIEASALKLTYSQKSGSRENLAHNYLSLSLSLSFPPSSLSLSLCSLSLTLLSYLSHLSLSSRPHLLAALCELLSGWLAGLVKKYKRPSWRILQLARGVPLSSGAIKLNILCPHPESFDWLRKHLEPSLLIGVIQFFKKSFDSCSLWPKHVISIMTWMKYQFLKFVNCFDETNKVSLDKMIQLFFYQDSI